MQSSPRMNTTLENIPIELTKHCVECLLIKGYRCSGCTIGIICNIDTSIMKCKRNTKWRIIHKIFRGDFDVHYRKISRKIQQGKWIYGKSIYDKNNGTYMCNHPIQFPLIPDVNKKGELCKHLICQHEHLKCSECIHFIDTNFYSIYSLSRVSKQLNYVMNILFRDELHIYFFFRNAKLKNFGF